MHVCQWGGGGQKVGTEVGAAKRAEGWMQRGRREKSRSSVDS